MVLLTEVTRLYLLLECHLVELKTRFAFADCVRLQDRALEVLPLQRRMKRFALLVGVWLQLRIPLSKS